jgi:Caudovirus prohead serine protease
MSVDVRQIAARLEDMFAGYDRQMKLQPPSISYPQAPTRQTLPTSVSHEQLLAAMSKKASPTPVQALSGNKLEGYCAVWLDDKGKPYIDSYDDMTVPNSWKDCIAYWQQERRATNRPHLIPHMRDHQTQIGGVLHLAEDSKGVIYQTQLSNTPLAQETYALAKDNFIGTSYGYDPVVTDYVSTGSKRARRLLKIMAHERRLVA